MFTKSAAIPRKVMSLQSPTAWIVNVVGTVSRISRLVVAVVLVGAQPTLAQILYTARATELQARDVQDPDVPLWTASTSSTINGVWVVPDGGNAVVLVVHGQSPQTMAVDGVSGLVLWSISGSVSAGEQADVHRQLYVNQIGLPHGGPRFGDAAPSVLLVSSAGGSNTTRLVNSRTGQVYWTRTEASATYGAAFIPGGEGRPMRFDVLMRSNDSSMLRIDGTAGQTVLWSRAIGSATPFSIPDITGDQEYDVVTRSNYSDTIYWLSGSSGVTVRTLGYGSFDVLGAAIVQGSGGSSSDTVFAAQNGPMARYRNSTGARVWSQAAFTNTTMRGIFDRGSAGAAVLAGLRHERRVGALSVNDGRVLWNNVPCDDEDSGAFGATDLTGDGMEDVFSISAGQLRLYNGSTGVLVGSFSPVPATSGAVWTQDLTAPDLLPDRPGTQTSFARWRYEDENIENVNFDDIDWDRPTAVLIHGWSSQGYLEHEEATYWITQFVDVAKDRNTGAYRDQDRAQIVVTNWKDRADPLFGVSNRDVWLSARNGFADGQVVGRALSNRNVDADHLHLIGHSNGSAFAAGITSSFYEATGGRKIGQLTVIDAPSEASLGVPTGVLAQNAFGDVQYFENWAFSGESIEEFGEQMGGGNTTNVLASMYVTGRITEDKWWYLFHSKLPLRYARSARYGLNYSEVPFVDHSVTLNRAPLSPGVWRESLRNIWSFDGQPMWHPTWRITGTLDYDSDEATWRGYNAQHIGTSGELAFRCSGVGDLYVEFVIEPHFNLHPWTRLATWNLKTLDSFDAPIYVFCDDEYVGSVEVHGQVGSLGSQRSLLNYQQWTEPVKLGFWLPADGNQSRGFEISDVLIHDTRYYITSN